MDYYFWINSDWAYLGADRLEEIANKYGVHIHYKPVDLLDVYTRSGGIPLPERSAARRDYREQELRRWMKRLGVTVNITPKYMCPDGSKASRLVIAADTLGHPIARLYKSILAAQWCDDRDISDPEVLLDVAQRQGYPGSELLALADREEIMDRYRQYTDEAVAAGVFGSPTYVLYGEVFWGQDRLDFLEEALV